MTITITLTSAGSDSGPFDLYTNATGSFTLMEAGVNKNTLLAGYTVTTLDGTTVIRVQSTGECTNYQDISVTTSTTTQLPAQYYGFQAIHPEAQGGTDYVRYIDEFGVEQTFTLIRDDINGNPCEAIYAQSIIQTVGAISCAV